MIEFTDNNTPYAPLFDDIYFNKYDGLAETKHVFLAGNNLPNAWDHLETITVIETGFGTGLNFLATWSLFEQNQKPNQKLHFISVEKHPLSTSDISKSLSRWDKDLGTYTKQLIDFYPIRIPGFHKIRFGDTVELLLIFEDVHDALPKIETQADFWFLDGFSPSKNPDMWTQDLFDQMSHLSHDQTHLASFTAAGHVRRDLEKAGFNVKKAEGFNKKRDMTVARFGKDIKRKTPATPPKKISIIGAGLAGCAVASVLRSYNVQVTLFEKGDDVASGASGNALGLINPKLGSTGSVMQDYHASAFAMAHRSFKTLEFFNQCGSLHVAHTDRRREKFDKFLKKSAWQSDHAHRVEAQDTKEFCGVEIDHGGIFLPESGCISPKNLCQHYAQDIDIRLNTEVKSNDLKQDENITLIANANSAIQFLEGLYLQPIKGQVGYIDASLPLKSNLCFGGYMSPAVEGLHCLGASFHRGVDDTQYSSEDFEGILEKLNTVLPSPILVKPKNEWVGVRCASKDKLPITGQWSDNLYTTIAHGSHGIISSLLSAHILGYRFGFGIQPVGTHILNGLDPERFK